MTSRMFRRATHEKEALESNESSVPICWESDRSENSGPEDWLALM